MEYKIKDIVNSLNCGISKYYRLKENLDNSITEQNKIEYYYNKGRNLFFTEKGYQWFMDNNDVPIEKKKESQNDNNSISLYQDRIIDIYKNQLEEYKARIEFLENENKRLLDIISVREQRDLAKDVHVLGNSETNSFFAKLFKKIKK